MTTASSSADSTSITSSNSDGASSSSPTSSSAAAFPSQWPSVIVPVSGMPAVPNDFMLISILFTDALSWSWLLSNSDSSAQVFAYMPQLIATVLNTTTSNIYTDSLQAYQTANSSGTGDILAVYLAYIPSSDVDVLSDAIKAPNSAFYTSGSGISKDLSQVVNPNLPILSFAAQGVSNSATTDGSSTASSLNGLVAAQTSNTKKRKIIISVVTVLGVLILGILAFTAFRRARKNSKNGASRSSSSLRSRSRSTTTAPSLRPFRLNNNDNGQSGGGMRQTQGPSPTIGWWNNRPTSTASSFSSGSDDSNDSAYSGTSAGRAGVGVGGGTTRQQQQGGGGNGHTSGRSSSIDFASVNMDEVRNSWWRFSDGFGRAHSTPDTLSVMSPTSTGHGYGSVLSPATAAGATMAIRQNSNSNRRINIQRTARGGVSGISRPTMQENSLLL